MTSSLPLVSGVMAAYNYERFLPEALESMLMQDYPPERLELIVVDDGSTDGTAEIARRYAQESGGRVRYVRQGNAGPAAATTRGLQEARGDFIALLDADDVWPISRTRLLVGALQRNPAAGLVYGDMEVIDADGRTLAASWLQEARQTPYRGLVAAQTLRSNFVMTSSLMVRADLRDRFCPIPTFFPTQDWPIVARVAEVAEVDFLPATVARYRRHGANLSNGKHSPPEVAALFRRDVDMRRWMLANVRANHLTVEDLVAAHDYFRQTLDFITQVQHIPPERFVEVSAADRAQASQEMAAGQSALADGDFLQAASHFLGAVSADPFDERARDGLDNAQRRLVVPLPRHSSGAGPADASEYRIMPGYRSRLEPEYLVDLVEERRGIVAQPDVYAQAVEVALRLGATRLIDLGAGSGAKLQALHPTFEILGLDHGPNVELARRRLPDGIWREHDLDQAAPLPLNESELCGSVVICANVIEQLVRPEFLLGHLRGLMHHVEAIVISTPDRDLTHGPANAGPPPDAFRVREWNMQEFAALLESWGFEYGELGLTRADDAGQVQSTLLAVLYPDADRVRRVDSAALSAV